jgi:hypothetical protein
MLRQSGVLTQMNELFDPQWKLLGDSAYIGNNFPFIITPKRDTGLLTEEDRQTNACISQGRVIIENAFGLMKCRFRRVRDIQNTDLLIIIRVILAACTLHNMLSTHADHCDEHPEGCPRGNDDNDHNDD